MSDAASPPMRRRLLQGLAAFSGALAVGCGGGGSGVGTGGTGDGAGTQPGGDLPSGGGTAVDGGAGPGGTPGPLPGAVNATVVGPVTGFGSVFVAGVRFDVDAARIASEDQPSLRADELRLGMIVQVQGTVGADAVSGTAAQVLVFGEVRGPITRIDAAAGSMWVVGTPVAVDARTVFDGIGGLSALRTGDHVEVYGLPGQPGAPIAATRVARARAPTQGGGPLKMRGVAVDVDLAARRCSVNGLLVSYASVGSPAAWLVEGTPVVVRADALPAAGPIQATRIDADRSPTPSEGAPTRLEGTVGGFRSLADFKVGGVAVDASAPGVRFDDAPAAALRNGLKVRVDGIFRNGTLRADRVTIDAAGGPQVLEFAGPIESFVSPADFVVRGQRVDASGSGVRFVPGRLGVASLAQGLTVEVRGVLVNGVLVASRVRFND